MIYVTGDTHGNWSGRLRSQAFPEQKTMTKDDYVVILGDFGLWDDSKSEREHLDWLDEKPFTTLFVSGNHENYDLLDAMEVCEWNGGKVNFVRPSVIHLMRGQVYNIDGCSIFTFGGARSHDISSGILEPDDPLFHTKKRQLDKNPFSLYRINHVSWWERELPSKEEMQEGVKNLKKAGNKVDFIFTHSPFTSLLCEIGSGLYEKDYLTDYLQTIHDYVDYKVWMFGHMHLNERYSHEKSICLYEQITRIM